MYRRMETIRHTFPKTTEALFQVNVRDSRCQDSHEPPTSTARTRRRGATEKLRAAFREFWRTAHKMFPRIWLGPRLRRRQRPLTLFAGCYTLTNSPLDFRSSSNYGRAEGCNRFYVSFYSRATPFDDRALFFEHGGVFFAIHFDKER